MLLLLVVGVVLRGRVGLSLSPPPAPLPPLLPPTNGHSISGTGTGEGLLIQTASGKTNLTYPHREASIGFALKSQSQLQASISSSNVLQQINVGKCTADQRQMYCRSTANVLQINGKHTADQRQTYCRSTENVLQIYGKCTAD